MTKTEVINYLLSCNEHEICSVFYEVFKDKKEIYREGGAEMIDDAFVMVRAVFREAPADFTVIAMPKTSCEGYISDITTQNGFCEQCQIEEEGFAKDSICPICDNDVWMT